MGVSCNIYLPPDVRADHIADVVAILTGSKVTETRIGGSSAIFTDILPEPIQTPFSNDIGAGWIIPQSEFAKEIYVKLAVFHATPFKGQTYTNISFGSSPVRVAIASRLIHWFGGVVVANDCSGDVTHRSNRHCPTEEDGILPHDAAWDDYQRALLRLRPLRKREIEAARKYAAYKEDD